MVFRGFGFVFFKSVVHFGRYFRELALKINFELEDKAYSSAPPDAFLSGQSLQELLRRQL